jgi:hypothetical protein
MSWHKDGGPKSNVWGFYFIEIKWAFSIVLLKFEGNSREAFHSHAFNSINWILKGTLRERVWEDEPKTVYKMNPSIFPIKVGRDRVHRVWSRFGPAWALSFRGPWSKTWFEIRQGKKVMLEHGRVEA